METKTCKVCGRELPLAEFRVTRWGGKAEVCNGCIREKRAQSGYERSQIGGGQDRFLFRPGLRRESPGRSLAADVPRPEMARKPGLCHKALRRVSRNKNKKIKN